jgi:predicted PurR-regulated permease PerM
MFKLIVVVLLTLIALSVIQVANNQSLTEQDKHTLFIKKQEAEKIENNKRTEKEKEKLQLDANMAALKSKSFSELKTTSEQMQWVGLNSEKVMIILVAGFFFLILINKFRHNAP